MRFSAVKKIEFCYGHRLINYEGVCSRLHGHNAIVEIEIQGKVLDKKGMIVDFTEIKNKVKKFIDETLDHKMILNYKDPLVEILNQNNEIVYTLTGNPTAEYLAKFIYKTCRFHLDLPVSKVTFYETPSSYSVYKRGD